MPQPYHFRSIHYTGQGPGPRVIVMGAVHGNETAGTQGIARVMAQLDSGELAIANGSVTFVPVVNPLAYAKRQRAGDRNLNRNLFPKADPQDFEDRVANWLCPLLAAHDVLLDLHSFSAAGEPFVTVGPRDNDGPVEPFRHSAAERALARVIGVRRFMDGWMRAYGNGVQRRVRDGAELETVLRYGVGTTEYMRRTGGYALTLECGQHEDPQAPEVAYTAIMNTLAHLGLVNAPRPAPIPLDRMEILSMTQVYDKQHDDDTFSRAWSSFDRLYQGDEIGRRADGTPVLAEADGVILFPDAEAKANNEWYYLARVNSDF